MMSTEKTEEKEDKKLSRGFHRLYDLRDKRKRGRVTFYTDGSGKVNEIEIVEKE